MNKEEINEQSMQNQAYNRKKIEIANGCYVTFCWPSEGD